MIAYERGPPLNADGLRQRHGAVRLVSGEVLQAARVRLLLPVLSQKVRRERRKKVLLLSSEENTRSSRCHVALPAALPLQKPA